MKKIIKGGTLVNEYRQYKADIVINHGCIEAILPEGVTTEDAEIIPAEGCYVLPGVIDDQVHFREPGLTHKGNIAEGSRAAAAGGVTSFMDMPNVLPPTTTKKLLEEKQEIASRTSLVNYSFYLGASKDNINEIKHVDTRTTCGIKLFMGASTGNLLVDDLPTLERIFAESPILIATHCEDTPTINQNLARYKEKYGDNIPPQCHPLIRNREACLKSSSLAVSLAKKFGSRLHVLHLSTADELVLFEQGPVSGKKITAEVCAHHLWFNDEAYLNKGNFVKWNPAIKTEKDRQALLQALNEKVIDVIATDHAPHTISEKSGPYTQAASGGPLVQHSLVILLELARQGAITIERVVDGMCHAPALLFGIEKRGFLREGYKADICIVEKNTWIVNKENLLYQCGWSPLEGQTFHHKVRTTLVNGTIVYDKGDFPATPQGELLTFSR
ncbi:MAG TPA: dihydroorotase [Candidatus Odoribacter faecigallinarum]|uniref:Dihydroorotase n=1 Tax=Candidatus Odoribacter faecigallinarum TaxID=2838706 RepID=A0A9D2ABM2_9BACT|nr:dihydroorotase [Candidatus Odoribacter faecigallinarum]